VQTQFRILAAWFQPHTITILLCSQLEYSSKKRQNQAKNKNSSQKLPISNYFKQLQGISQKISRKKTQIKQLQPCRPHGKNLFCEFQFAQKKQKAIHHLNMSFFSDAKQIHKTAIQCYICEKYIYAYISRYKERRV